MSRIGRDVRATEKPFGQESGSPKFIAGLCACYVDGWGRDEGPTASTATAILVSQLQSGYGFRAPATSVGATGYPSSMSDTFTAELWDAKSTGAWVFVSLPEDLSDAIAGVPRPPRPGFGSLRVEAKIGATTWATSIFPDSKRGCYVLPVKKAVRIAEGVEIGDPVEVTVELSE